MAAELEKLYGHIDALEYFVGMILEKRRHPQVFGETLTEIGSPYSLKGISLDAKLLHEDILYI